MIMRNWVSHWSGLTLELGSPDIKVITMLSRNTLADADLRRRGIGAWFFKPVVYDEIRRAITNAAL